MKTDKELLELAAKACGLLKEYCSGEFTNFGVFLMPTPERPDFSKAGAEAIDAKAVELVKWNPLTDDGDAFRLAVKLDMQVTIDINGGEVWVLHNSLPQMIVESLDGADIYEATRLTITRAAAAIGESK